LMRRASTPIDVRRFTPGRLRRALADITFPHAEGVTASRGVAELNHHDHVLQGVLALAAKALFRAKASGRNQTAVG